MTTANRRSWTSREESTLRSQWLAGVPSKTIADQIKRSHSAVRSRAKVLNLRRPSRHVYTVDNDKLIREHYSSRGASWCAERIGSSLRGVHARAKRLGLTKLRPRVDYVLLNLLLDSLHPQGFTDGEIAESYQKETGFVMDRHTVQFLRSERGLSHNCQSTRQRRKIATKTKAQCQAAGVDSLADVRRKAFKKFALDCGWPQEFPPRAVQILNAIYEQGPMTRRELCEAIGVPWKGSRASLAWVPGGAMRHKSRGSYLAYLQHQGFIVAIRRANRVVGQGTGKSTDVYAIPLTIKRGESKTWPNNDFIAH